jgi:hypothetical protein
MQLDLFRIKVFPDGAPTLFDEPLNPSDALRAALVERSTTSPRRGVSWHVGNVEPLDESAYYLRLGKRSRSTVPMLDEKGNFREASFEHAPYTHAIVDVVSEVCALARKTNLAPSTRNIAGRLSLVLNESASARDRRARFVVDAMRDPDEFLQLLQTAYAVKTFTFTFQGRNPMDAHELFVQPFEQLCTEANAYEGQATLKGDDLVVEPLQEITRSAAATGDTAKARLQLTEGTKAVVRKLQGDTASIGVQDLDSREEKLAALQLARLEHRRIRGDLDAV